MTAASESNGAVLEVFSILGCLSYFGEGHVGGAEVSLGGFEDEDVSWLVSTGIMGEKPENRGR
ncbi:hypothetical protein N0V92_000835 [Colletotrichum tropicale]|nr:hypothetical protein N0V92_000835 [Colletotrichum tropicale]